MVEVSRSELILGGQKSGKSSRAELLSRAWLMASPTHRAVLVATLDANPDFVAANIANLCLMGDRPTRARACC